MHKLLLLLLVGSGAASGWLYHKFVGCASGACIITSNPYTSVLYGAAMGYVVAGLLPESAKPVALKRKHRCERE